MLQEEIRRVFANHPEILYGFADLSGTPFADSFASALVLAAPYGEQLSLETYAEPRFEQGICSARDALELASARVTEVLRRDRAVFRIPPAAQENEQELRAPFSFKTAAARAGLGWFGKNDVIITERYGPRVRLAAILIDEIFEYGQPVTESRCPDGCTRCVDACPCGALKNRRWTPDTDRAEIIDYHRCNRMRSAFIPSLGRKSACGLCMAACPVGLENHGGQTR